MANGPKAISLLPTKQASTNPLWFPTRAVSVRDRNHPGVAIPLPYRGARYTRLPPRPHIEMTITTKGVEYERYVAMAGQAKDSASTSPPTVLDLRRRPLSIQ